MDCLATGLEAPGTAAPTALPYPPPGGPALPRTRPNPVHSGSAMPLESP